LKRVFDITLALIALAVLWPLLLVVALAIRLDSPGPALFRQPRVGIGGRPFHMFKFRSMVVDAERVGGYSTAVGDPRITRVGHFIRRTSLDELPQLFNVLRGDMSWVGPRPDVPAQKGNYCDADWRARHRVRPGITGLAQATLRSAATPAQRLALDLEYVERASLLFDLKILLLTVRQVLGKGSY
jgi:lipopolysaccharide/colanic/teichoic acid biosynthesis glycosyltransferase